MKRYILINVLILSTYFVESQDLNYVKSIIDTLSSATMYGRGYVREGDLKAANFIRGEFINNSTKSFGNDYFQQVNFSVNTFPSKMSVKVNDTNLEPFADYRINASTGSISGSFDVFEFNVKDITDINKIEKFCSKRDLSNSFVLLDITKFSEKFKKKEQYKPFQKKLRLINLENPFKSRGIIIVDKQVDAFFAWGNKAPLNYTLIKLAKSKKTKKIKQIELSIENQYLPNYTSNNVISYIEGSQRPDSFIVFCAHYDHLGCMGENIYFPGANDNASGVATVLDLSKYYSKPENKPYYSVAFISFTGEEAGLLGSEYYTKNSLFPLSKIKFLINLDMVGTGENGIHIVNAEKQKPAFNLLDSINTQHQYVTKVFSRGESANSDHYYFHKEGVPAVFFFGAGKSGPYHHPDDKLENLSLGGYEGMFKLIVDFVNLYR